MSSGVAGLAVSKRGAVRPLSRLVAYGATERKVEYHAFLFANNKFPSKLIPSQSGRILLLNFWLECSVTLVDLKLRFWT